MPTLIGGMRMFQLLVRSKHHKERLVDELQLGGLAKVYSVAKDLLVLIAGMSYCLEFVVRSL